MAYQASVSLRSVDAGLRFDGGVAGFTVPLDSGPGAAAPSPIQILLVSLAGCTAMDVIVILRKKRLRVTAYEVTVSGERRDEHPRVFTRLEIRHRVTGHALPRAAVEDAVRLSDTKYCAVHAMIEASVPITSVVEVLPA
jgi:putative redox protein